MASEPDVFIVEKHSRAIRWCHWINFPLLLVMTWSGILIYWANDAYIPIPTNISEFLGIGEKLAEGMGWHALLMWPFVINGIIYCVYLIFSGEWRDIVPGRNSLKEAIQVALYDMKFTKTHPEVINKYNGAQKIAYSSVLVFTIINVVSGFAIYKPVQLSFLTGFFGGYEGARLVHFVTMSLICGFFFIHIVQVVKAGWNTARAMVSGYEITNERKENSKK